MPTWTLCEHNINECARNPCQHGRCGNKDGGYKCTCSPGWTGQNCQQDINECTSKPCQHGRCVNKDGGYKCTCSPGWTGPNCQQASRLPCAGGWTERNNYCYKVIGNKVSWTEANPQCKQLGANLASVQSAAENKILADLISHAPQGKLPLVWIGLKRDVAGQLKWTDGSPVSYTNWAAGQPSNNGLRGGEDCVGMYSKRGKDHWWFTVKERNTGQWNDVTCGGKYPYICKRPK
ncbi:neurocan core protein-like [Branchiostoma lanceolatum]|uniref:neurocan core protein-like n=1 Tax=Branchiostoma lanceolatum TaxID=7740 RepID=UPI003451C7F4